MCKLPISAHKLNIEVGRYNKIPRNERFCKKCKTGEIEDEMHFLLLCNHFETDRTNILDIVLFYYIESFPGQLTFINYKIQDTR
jgi:hypothetical protein